MLPELFRNSNLRVLQPCVFAECLRPRRLLFAGKQLGDFFSGRVFRRGALCTFIVHENLKMEHGGCGSTYAAGPTSQIRKHCLPHGRTPVVETGNCRDDEIDA